MEGFIRAGLEHLSNHARSFSRDGGGADGDEDHESAAIKKQFATKR